MVQLTEGLLWEFVGEGRSSCILRPLTTRTPRFVARVRKRKPQDESAMQPSDAEKLEFCNFARSLLPSELVDCVSTLERHVVPEGILRQMQAAVTQADRPSSRIEEGTIPSNIAVVHTMYDFGSPLTPQPRDTVTIEIKPKVPGLEMMGPCRYCRMQGFKLAQGRESKPTQYCPIYLYSRKREHVEKALRSLFDEAQNNLRWLEAGRVCNDHHPVELCSRSYFGRRFNGNALNAYISAVAEVLMSSPILSALWEIQTVCDLPLAYFFSVYQELSQRGTLDQFSWKGYPLGCTLGEVQQFMIQVRSWPFEEGLSDIPSSQLEALLRVFSLAMSYKDCSLLVSVAPTEAVEGKWPCVQTSTGDYCYRLGLVDLDFKDPKKLPYYYGRESEIDKFAPRQPCLWDLLEVKQVFSSL